MTAAPAGIPPALVPAYRPANRYGFVQAAGAQLRFACWNAVAAPAGAPCRGTVVLLGGRTEFVEKYTEVIGDLLQRGFAVFALDWRGQGLSDRALPDRDKGHIDRFETYIADLRLFLEAIVAPQAAPPLLVLGHSMGGHITLRALAEGAARTFAAAVLVSPMMGLKREWMLRAVLAVTPALPAVDRRYLFGSGPFATMPHPFEGNQLTHDERRYRVTDDWFAADRRLSLGGPTFGWCRAAARSMSVARRPDYLERIDLPLLLASGGEDDLVDPASHPPVARRVRRGELLVIAGARHEILMEIDDIRARFWQAFDRFTSGLPSS